jgi:hypothetical protein
MTRQPVPIWQRKPRSKSTDEQIAAIQANLGRIAMRLKKLPTHGCETAPCHCKRCRKRAILLKLRDEAAWRLEFLFSVQEHRPVRIVREKDGRLGQAFSVSYDPATLAVEREAQLDQPKRAPLPRKRVGDAIVTKGAPRHAEKAKDDTGSPLFEELYEQRRAGGNIPFVRVVKRSREPSRFFNKKGE